MAGTTKDAWEEVGSRFSDWGRKLSEQYHRREEERGGPEPEADRRKLEEALQAAVRQLDVAFTSLGETLRDPEAKRTLGDAARALGDAVSITVTEAGAQIRKRTGGEKGSSEPPPPPIDAS